MKLIMIAVAAAVVLASPVASARSHHRHHGWMHSYGSAARTNPNGTAGGPTSVSGTGSSKFGGQVPGAPGVTRQ
ncbi:hypothetical protein [Bradyrhizobium sp. STM 3557]|uniref:hypothetical protein n=1 Tax=Bradyrhizobium sp. STM 3557 TaxID=578920 RepID=UPI00388F30EC